MTATKTVAVVSGAAAVAGAAVAARRHRAAEAANEPPAFDVIAIATPREETKAELYERAKALGIRGRSKMNKPELQRALAARSPGAAA
ncbi:MAG: hypothetical protein M3340_00870 [Actinomycetota bacterium]|nr:hypothetical protein [Actinomycetota bacterium]